MRSVEIPYLPRPHFFPFHNRTQRWAVLVCHRRAGKTVSTVNDTIRRALREGKRDGRYAIIFPLRSQAKDTAWAYLKYFAGPVMSTASESDLFVRLVTGAVVRLYGSDNPDAMRGPYLDGAVLDEFSQHRPDVWSAVVRPMLSDRRGWATFIGTPKGKNEFYELWTEAQKLSATWFTLMIKASESGLLPQDELDEMRIDMGDDMYDQEMECSFEAAIRGAFYAKEMRSMLAEKRIRPIAIDPSARVYTGWDLGRGDSTAIWFMQAIGRERRLIDYYEGSNIDLEHYVQVLLEKRILGKYEYGGHFFPHDLAVTELMAKESRKSFMEKNLGSSLVHVVPNHAVLDGIQFTRSFINKAAIDPNRCFRGLEALRQYRRQWNKDRKDWETGPYHDWTSHGADAVRTLAIGYEEPKLPSPQSRRPVNAEGATSWAA